MKFNNIYILLFFLSLLFSCKKEELGPYNTNFVYSPSNIVFRDKISFNEGEEFTGEIKFEYADVVKTTKFAPADMTVTFEVDKEALAEYNKKNKTSYDLLEIAEVSPISIKKGESSFSPLKVEIKDKEKLKDLTSTDFMLPLRIVCNYGSNVRVSKKLNMIYYTLKVDITRVALEKQLKLGLNLIANDEASWKIYLENEEAAKKIDNNKSGDNLSPRMSLTSGINNLFLDLGKKRSVSSASFSVLKEWGFFYTPKKLILYVSEDGNKYLNMGQFDIIYNRSDDIRKYCNFFNTKEIRYIKFVFSGSGSFFDDPVLVDLRVYN